LTIEYAIKLKQIFGENLFVLGYSNDVMGYIPSLTVLSEGGYEAISSQFYRTHPSAWATSIETTILSECIRLNKEVRKKADRKR
jgi:neutral ceramidase